MERVFFEITVIICLAAILSYIFRIFKQPPILAYILTGIVLGPLALFKLQNGEMLHGLSQIGITLLLFTLGIELKLSELHSVGKTALITGVSQILITSSIGFLICKALGFSAIASLYMGIALTFSSTIIIVKLLSDKKDLKSLYGKIAVAILLVQDFVAIIILILLSGFNSVGAESFSIMNFVLLGMRAIILFGWTYVISKYLLPKVVTSVAHNSETLFIFSLAWAFGMSAFASSPFIGFSIEIGGFLAGLSLANSTQNYQIGSKIRSLRDFFITIFFVTLGMSLLFENIVAIWIPALILALFVLIGNPLILMSIVGIMGYRKRTSFLVGLTVAQISEFSMIVMFMGNKLGHVPDKAVSLITLSGTITFVLSTYMILHGNKLFKLLSPALDIFERKTSHEEKITIGELEDHVVLIGANKVGSTILETLLHEKENVLVVDFNPDLIEQMKKEKIPFVFGDMVDPEIQERAQLDKAKLVISTATDVEDNLLLLKSLRHNRKAKVIVVAVDGEEAKLLYKKGADYVLMPHLAGGRHLARIIVDDKKLELIEHYKAKDLEYLD